MSIAGRKKNCCILHYICVSYYRLHNQVETFCIALPFSYVISGYRVYVSWVSQILSMREIEFFSDFSLSIYNWTQLFFNIFRNFHRLKEPRYSSTNAFTVKTIIVYRWPGQRFLSARGLGSTLTQLVAIKKNDFVKKICRWRSIRSIPQLYHYY